jgi:hypothetical protein
MPAASGIAAFGTLLKIGDGQVSESFATVAEVTDIEGPGGKTSTVDITNHSSPSAFKEIVPTTIDPGTIKLTVNFLPSAVTQNYNTGLLRDWIQRNKRNFQIIWPNVAGTYVTFAAYVIEFDQKAPVDGKLSATFSLEVTGVYTWTN